MKTILPDFIARKKGTFVSLVFFIHSKDNVQEVKICGSRLSLRLSDRNLPARAGEHVGHLTALAVLG
jgi:hypothetical protein